MRNNKIFPLTTLALPCALGLQMLVLTPACFGKEETKSVKSEEPEHHSKHINTTGVCSSIVIQAPPELVWLTVHEERQNAPDLAYSKVIQQGTNEVQIEQKFKFWSGGAKCLMQHKEIPNQRIDYTLIKSDHLKQLRGSWIFTPSKDRKETTLELSSEIDYGFLMPKAVANSLMTKVIERRLAHIKKMAEDHREELEVKGRVLSAAHLGERP